MGVPFIYYIGPAQALGASGSASLPLCLPHSTGEDNNRQNVPSNFLVRQAVSQGKIHQRREPRDPRNSHFTRNSFNLSLALLFHLTASRILNGYLSPFLEKDKRQKQLQAPLSRH